MKKQTFPMTDLRRAFGAGFKLGRKSQRLLGYFNYSVETRPKPKTKDCMLTVNLTTEEQVNVKLTPVTPRGKPAKVDGVPEWQVISGNATLTPAADGLSCVIVSGDDPGTTEVAVKADADLGEGVEEISDFIEAVVGGVKAISLGLIADAPTPKP